MKNSERVIVGNKYKIGIAPAIALINPKYLHNIGAVIRAASCYGIKQVWYSGDRIKISDEVRIPREERMKGYKDVELIQYDYIFDQFSKDVTPVAIEVRDNAQMLTDFEHPKNALYVFGPEDGGLNSMIASHCHHFVIIPTNHCLNLSAAVNTVLYDRRLKNYWNGYEQYTGLNEVRGFVDDDNSNLLTPKIKNF